jgi:hypothetical protein
MKDACPGGGAVLRQDPHSQPKATKKPPVPSFHVTIFAAFTALRNASGAFLETFRKAAYTWKEKAHTEILPVGSFPPGPPFVRAGPVS